jgi:hypothetical protein
MTSIIDAGTVNAFSQAVEELASKAGAAAVQYGPEALNIATQYVHAMAVLSVIKDMIGLGFCALAVFLYSKLWVLAQKAIGYDDDMSAVYAIRGVFGAATIGFTVTLGLICIIDFLSPQTFFGLFIPKMAVLNYAISIATPAS